MTKAEQAKAWAQARVGCPYIYGATGKPCTPSYRQDRMDQYPKYADKIKKTCPRLSGKAASCASCRWCDPETKKGKTAYDCAQLVRWCMNDVGIKMVSGANSQWKETEWSQAGEIGTMPRGKLCLVYRYDTDHMGHTGIYTGDGYIIHAKGHDYGVVRELLGNPRFTHWGIPVGLYEQETPTQAPGDGDWPVLKKGASGPYVYCLQALLTIRGQDPGTIDGKFGAKTEGALRYYQERQAIPATGICGALTWEALTGRNEKPNETDGYFILPTAQADRVRSMLQEAVEIMKK